MVTIHRGQGFKVVIFLDDHEPAQVHVFGDGQAKINRIGAEGAPALVWSCGMKRNEVRRAMRLVYDRQAFFLTRWQDIHG